jgi:hypothetical protein
VKTNAIAQLANVVTSTRKLKAVDIYRAFGLVNTSGTGEITQLANFVASNRKLNALGEVPQLTF